MKTEISCGAIVTEYSTSKPQISIDASKRASIHRSLRVKTKNSKVVE